MPWYLFLDLETTGLNPDICQPIEAAWILVDESFGSRSEGEAAFYAGDATWEPAAFEMAQESGALRDPTRPWMTSTFNLFDDIVASRVRSVEYDVWLAGNSVQFDRRFIRRFFPETDGALSHRHFDVRTAMNLVGWKEDDDGPTHRAYEDVERSLRIARSIRSRISLDD